MYVFSLDAMMCIGSSTYVPGPAAPLSLFSREAIKSIQDVKEVKRAIDLKQCTRVSKGEYQLEVEG